MPSRPATSSGDSRFELSALFEFSTIVNGTLDTTFILGHFLLTLMGKLLSVRGAILLERSAARFSVVNVKGLPAHLVGSDVVIEKVPRRFVYSDSGDSDRSIRFFSEHGLRLIVPLLAQDKIVGLAGFAPSLLRKKLTPKEATYVRSLANIAAAAVEKSLIIAEVNQVNRRLDGKIQELNTLFELGKEFGSVLDREQLIKLLMFAVMGQIGANRFLICLEQNSVMEAVASRLDNPVPGDLLAFFPSVTSPVNVSSMTRKNERRWQALLSESGIHAVIPLQIQNKTKGVLALGEKMRGGAYSKADLDFLFSLGNLAIISLENARLFNEAIEKQRLEDELLIAREIQRGLLPSHLPAIAGFEIAATNISSKQVGGDYYDIIELGSDRFLLAIGDVSGKGTPASLLMANLQATIRALVPLGLPLSELTRRVNDLLCENTGLDRFITFFWGMLDSSHGTLHYVSAGHNPPILLRSGGEIERLDIGGIILGIMKAHIPYQEGVTRIGPGDVLVMFTDGISEAMDARGEEFGEEKLLEIIRSWRCSPAASILTGIVDAVKEHSRNTSQYDDITLLVLKSNG